MEQTAVATDKVPIDQLAQLASDKSVLFFGVVPLVAIGVLAVACVILYYYRRSKNWNELGEAMRLDEGDKPIAEHTPFDSAQASELDPTKPSQRLGKMGKNE